jgi:hypothetical protein
MKKFLVILVVLALALPAVAGTVVLVKKPVSGGGSAISDNFNRASLGADWTSDIGTGATEDSANFHFTARSGGVGLCRYSALATSTASQWASVKLTTVIGLGDVEMGIGLRMTNAITDPRYTLIVGGYGISRLASWTGTTWNHELGWCAITVVNGDTIGVEVSGTGDPTTIKLWLNPGAHPSSGSWATPACTWVLGASSVTASHAAPATDHWGRGAATTFADAGRYVGIHMSGADTSSEKWDDFAGGDIAP